MAIHSSSPHDQRPGPAVVTLPSENQLAAMHTILGAAYQCKRRPSYMAMERYSALQWLAYAVSPPRTGQRLKTTTIRPIRVLAFRHVADCWAEGETPLDLATRFNHVVRQFPGEVRDDALSGLAQSLLDTKGMLAVRLADADHAERTQVARLKERLRELVTTKTTATSSAAELIMRGLAFKPARPAVGRRGTYELPLARPR